MRKMIALATGAVLLGGMMVSAPAEARPSYRHHGGYRAYPAPYAYGYRHYRRGNAGAAVALGVAGALVGGAIAAQQPRYYAPGYSYPAYAYPAYRTPGHYGYYGY